MIPLANAIDRIAVWIGKAGALFLPLLVLTILVNVTLRYVFNIGMIELEELQWHLNAVAVMACLAWCYQTDEHVRVDVLAMGWGPRRRAWVELFGVLLLLLPFIGIVGYHAFRIFSFSWDLKEGSPMPSGLPARYIIKGIMVVGLWLLLLQGVAVALRALATLMRKD